MDALDIQIEKVLAGGTVLVNMRKDSPDQDLIQWAKREKRFVSIDRKTKWGNPFLSFPSEREAACDTFAEWFPNQNAAGDIEELRGKVLGCWCVPKRCHGLTLLKMLGIETDNGDKPEEDPQRRLF